MARSRSFAFLLASTVVAGAIALHPLTPWAQTAGKGTGTLNEAKAHMDKGQELFLAKKFAEAAVEFHTAYEIKPFSTFLFNEAVCHEKLRAWDEAIRLFQKYVETDPTAPDNTATVARIEKLKAEREKEKAASEAGAAGDDGGTVAAEAGTPTPPPAFEAASIDEMRSIVVIESLPDGAPVEIWAKQDPSATAFVIGGANTGWAKVVLGKTTLQQSLPLGTYHIVIPKFQDYRATETDVTVAAATLSLFKANLAQGAFYGVMKIRSFDADAHREIRGAHVFVKKAGEVKFADRGITPYEESLESGSYVVRVEQPGFQAMEKKFEIAHGKLDERKFELARSDDGLVRVDGIQGADEAEVVFDGETVGTWKLGQKVEIKTRAGLHKIKIKADGLKTYTEELDVPRGKMLVVHADLKPKMGRGAAWSTGIAAAVFIGGGIYLGLQSNKLYDQVAEAKTGLRLDQEDTRIKRGQYFAIGADACFALGGVFALISLYNAVRDPLPPSRGYSESPRDLDVLPSAPRAPSARLYPTLGPGLAGLALMGEF